jgi:glutathione synthase/RimK-type ligase-like ATP-grasp enzyme
MTPYPVQTRYVKRACEALGLRFDDLDDGGGYLFAVSDGVHEFVSGSAAICTWPLNSAHAFGVSRDKHHTNTVLARAGLRIIPSRLFFLDERHVKMRAPGRERADALEAFAQMAKPVFCKPNAGSHGDFAECIADVASFRDYLGRVSRHHDMILLQPALEGHEYRVFCLDGEALFAVRKAEFALTGDGRSSLRDLLRARNRGVEGRGVSLVAEDVSLAALGLRHGVDGDHIAAAGERFVLPGRRNLSAGGEVDDFTTDVPVALARLALAAAKALGLRVAGIDIFDISPARDLSQLVVIEVNGNPGIQSLEAIGRDDLIDHIWQTVLTRFFAEMT